MKLVEIGYKNLYFKNEKDRYASLYGINTDISKIGFQTNAQSRGKILTKFEQVIRNSSVSFYSSRLHQELKTFIWKGQKAQAQKGKNDDLVISAAIGTWLFDADPKRNHQTTDLNKAMLKGFAVNQNEYGQKNSKAQWPHLSRFPLTPYRTPKEPGAKEGEDFKWLI
jgi:PKD repeat protein